MERDLFSFLGEPLRTGVPVGPDTRSFLLFTARPTFLPHSASPPPLPGQRAIPVNPTFPARWSERGRTFRLKGRVSPVLLDESPGSSRKRLDFFPLQSGPRCPVCRLPPLPLFQTRTPFFLPSLGPGLPFFPHITASLSLFFRWSFFNIF